MDIREAITYITNWLKENAICIGFYEQDKYSTMLALDTYSKIRCCDLRWEDTSCISEVRFTGDLIQLEKNRKAEKQEVVIPNKVDELEKRYFDKKNRMDTIDRLICYPLLKLDEREKEILFQDAILELSNVEFWKYEFVKNPFYCRKIHNSYHYLSPYSLLYHLSTMQMNESILPQDAESVLVKVILDGYQNFSKLNLFEASLLISSTPWKYRGCIFEILNEYLSKIEREGIPNIPFYYDYEQFGKFIGAKTYTAAVVLEALILGGKSDWKTFRVSLIGTRTSMSNYLIEQSVLTCTNRRKMKMKEHCMAPYIDEDDEIDVSYNLENIVNGDVIVFRHYTGAMMAHRVIDIIKKNNHTAYITAADNGGLWGYPVFMKDMVGKVIGIKRND